MIIKDVTITNRLGLHARPAALLVQTAAAFACDIKIKKEQTQVNAKSIMGVLMLAAEHGATLQIECNGSDEQAAFQAIAALFANKFNEEF